MGLFNLLTKTFDDYSNSIIRCVEDFSFADLKEEFDNMSSSFEKSMKKLKEHIKNLTDKFLVEVNYDRDNETLSFAFVDNVLSVTTRNKSGQVSTLATNIPEDVDISTLRQKYHKDTKKIEFIFDKLVEVDNKDIVEPLIEEDKDDTPMEHLKASKEELLQAAKGLLNNGWSVNKVAKELGVARTTLRNWLKKSVN